jgi:hypothetical protein
VAKTGTGSLSDRQLLDEMGCERNFRMQAAIASFHPSLAAPRNIRTPTRAKDSRLDSNDSITIFFFTDSVWGLRGSRLKLGPRVAGLSCGFHRPVMITSRLITR